jgi:hypothetical protein
VADEDTDVHRGAQRSGAHPVVWEFLRACEQDPSLGADYLRARDLWHAAATDHECDAADDALVDVIERFTDARNAVLTSAEVRAMRTLRDRPDR